MTQVGTAGTWGFVLLMVTMNTSGDLLTARAMRAVGDFDRIRAQRGLRGIFAAIMRCGQFYAALLAMTLGFFALLSALSYIDLSIVIPAAASLTFLANLLGAKFLLREHVSQRRWFAGLLVALGVLLVTH